MEPFFRALFVDVPSAQPALPSVPMTIPTAAPATAAATVPEETKVAVRPPSPPKAVEEEDDFFLCVCYRDVY